MVYSTIVLPAVMAWLGPRVNSLKIPYALDMSAKDDGMWARIAKRVMDRPWAVLIPTLVLLVGAGLPFAYAEFSLSSWKALPPDDESRLGMELIDEQWPDQAANSIFLVIDTDGADPLSEVNLRIQHAYLIELLSDARVAGWHRRRPAFSGNERGRRGAVLGGTRRIPDIRAGRLAGEPS